MRKALIIGAGISGCVLAEQLSARYHVTVIDKRNHIGGNSYDHEVNGMFVHRYGPHIFHTDKQHIWDYVNWFCGWRKYQHRVLAEIAGHLVPLPLNFTGIDVIYQDAEKVKRLLLETFPERNTVSILDLLNSDDEDIAEFGEFVYEHVYAGYSRKQWGTDPKALSKEVLRRVPVRLTYANRYFDDAYQALPIDGYTHLCDNLLNTSRVTLRLNREMTEENFNEYDVIYYTGRLDEFFDYSGGRLPYRKLRIETERLPNPQQPCFVQNYTYAQPEYTRTSDYACISDKCLPKTVVATEYPGTEGFDAWPLLTDVSKTLVRRYVEEAQKLSKVIFCGRLAEFRYYDIDDAIDNALRKAQEALV